MKKLLLLLTLITSNIFAQDLTKLKDFSTWSITPSFSTSHGNMDVNNLVPINTFNPGFDVNIRKQLSHFTSIQASYTNTTLQTQNNKLKYTSDINQLDARLCFNLTNGFIIDNWKRTQLYGYIGYGILWYNATRDNLDPYKGTTRVIPIGVGVKYNVNNHLSVVLDVNYNQSNTDRLDAYINSLTAKDGYSKTSLGITYTFGKKKVLEWSNPYPYLSTSVHSRDTIIVVNYDTIYEVPYDNAEPEIKGPESVVVYYESGKWDLDKSYLNNIDSLIAKAQFEDKDIYIESYTDTVGSNKRNLEVVLKRAGIIFQYIRNFYPSERIKAKMHDESYAIEADNALNRKSIIKIIK